MKWASTLSRTTDDIDAALAVQRGVLSLRDELKGDEPHLLAAFVSPQLTADAEKISRLLRDAFPTAMLVGCTGGGVIGGGHEAEQGGAIALLAAHLPGVTVTPFLARGSAVPVLAADAQALVLFAEPFSCDVHGLLERLDEAAPSVPKVGGMASGASVPGGHRLFLGKDVFTSGAVGVALSGALTVQTLVSQGCRPLGPPMFATRVDGHLLLELDSKPALEVLSALHAAASPDDQKLMRHSLFVGVEMRPENVEHQAGELLVRNLVGIEPQRKALAVASRLSEHQVVQFLVRDARAADEDLKLQLERAARSQSTPPAGGFLFSCNGRGAQLFGEADHDSRLFAEACGGAPLAGFFGNGEMGPVGGRTFLHGYTSAFVLFRPALH